MAMQEIQCCQQLRGKALLWSGGMAAVGCIATQGLIQKSSNMLACLSLVSAEDQALAMPSTDIWEDPIAMYLLCERIFPEGASTLCGTSG
jgi:hypothetical protein